MSQQRFEYVKFQTCDDMFYVYLGGLLVGSIQQTAKGWRVLCSDGDVYRTRVEAARQSWTRITQDMIA